MTILLLLFNLTILCALAWWWYRALPPAISGLYWPALGLKLIAGIGVGLLYFYHYGGGDTILFWRDGVVISENLRTHPFTTVGVMWNNDEADVQLSPGLIYNTDRAFFFVKILGVVAFFCGNNYWMMSVVLSFISFLATWYLFRIIVTYFPASRTAAAAAFLFFPPVVFWSSGVIKESLGLSSIYFLTGVFLLITFRQRVGVVEWVAALIFLWIGWRLKYYWLAMFLLTTTSVIIVARVGSKDQRMPAYALLFWMGLVIVLLLLVTSIHPNFSPERFFPMILENNQAFMKLSDTRNAVEYNHLTPDFVSMLLNSPKALIAGFFRPFLWESFNALSAVAGLANLFMLIAVLSAVPSLRNMAPSLNSLLIVATLFYCIVLATFLALSTPNLGTLDRYKIGFTPFLLFIALYGNPLLIKLLPAKDQPFPH